MFVTVTPRRATVFVVGDVDIATAPLLRDVLQSAVVASVHEVRVDLAEAGLFGAAGVNALVSTWRALQDTGTRLVVANASTSAQHVLALVRFHDLPGVVVESAAGRTARSTAGP